MITTSEPKKELTIGALQANVYSLIFVLPVLLLFGLPYLLVWQHTFSFENLTAALKAYKLWVMLSPLVFLLVMVAGIVVHELIHGLTWAVFCKMGYKSIRYGVMWQCLTPYCHCKEPLLLKHYCIGALMPALLLGALPSVVALLTGGFLWLLFGLAFTMAAGGDFLIIWMLRKEKKETYVQDHPDKIGCFVLESARDLASSAMNAGTDKG